MDTQINENHERYLDRVRIYRRNGYDIEKSRKFILNVSSPLTGKILEIGTGKGHTTLVLARSGYRFISVDISAQEQELARLNLRYYGVEYRVTFRIEDAQKMSFRDNSFDSIISVNTIHHVENPLKMMDEVARLLNRDGRAIISEFTKEGMDIIDRIHASEGRTHEHSASGVGLDDVEEYFTRKHFRIERKANAFQQVLVMYK